jgi:MFS transporter, DHA2 family, multidrug resistance protein
MAAAALTSETSAVRPPHKWLIALAVMVGATLEVLDTSIVNVSLPHMRGSFSASVDEIAWVVTSYLVANGVMIPMTGWIAARFGRKRYFMLSVGIFVAASMLCGAAGSLPQMVLFRLLQGVAGAAMIPLSQAILMETFPPNEQQLAMATWGMGLMVAPILGPTVGGWITDNWNWRWTFYMNLPLGGLALVMVSAFVHDPPHLSERNRGGAIDYLGIVYLVLWLGLAQIIFDRGERADWFNSSWVIWATIVSGLAMVLLVFREFRTAEPILELRFFGIPQFTSAIVSIVVLSFILFGTGVLNPLFLQEFMGYTAWKAGLIMAPRGFSAMLAMLLTGRLAARGVDTRPMIGLAFALIAAGLARMAQWDLDIAMSRVVIDGVVLGFGLGMCFPILSAAALGCVPRERVGFASSLYNMMRNNGAAIGIAFLTSRLVHNGNVHQAYLVQHFSAFDAWRLSNEPQYMPGSPKFALTTQMIAGQKQNLGMIYDAIQQQAIMLSFNDLYRILTVMAVMMIPSFLLFRGKLGGGGGGH